MDDGVALDVADLVEVAVVVVVVDDDVTASGGRIDGRVRVGRPIEMPPPTTGDGIKAALERVANPATEILE